jgi:hypothetical protein
VALTQREGLCSVPCGGGVRSVEYTCWVRGIGEVSQHDCPIPLPATQRCNEKACNYGYDSRRLRHVLTRRARCCDLSSMCVCVCRRCDVVALSGGGGL